MRIDLYLVEKGYFDSRTKAQRALSSGVIKVNDKIITKGSYEIEGNENILILEDVMPYVSQGGFKLEGAIKAFNLNFNDKVILDIGASTGGFTDCSLQNGAKLVYAVDVGTSQLVDKLKQDKRVISLENTNINTLPYIPNKIDIITMDVSFVSVTKLVDALDYYMNEASYLVLLIKPQFELGKIKFKNGIVKDKKMYLNAILSVNAALNSKNLYINKLIYSPIKGGSGNKEFLALVSRNFSKPLNFLSIINSES